MCTRLLDLTTNLLVALYFACKLNGQVKYSLGIENNEDEVIMEPYGIVYYVYNNERLVKQSGVFLLPGMFTVKQYSDDIKLIIFSSIEKSNVHIT